MSASSACSCGDSANENRPIRTMPAHSQTSDEPARMNTTKPKAPPRYAAMISGLRPTRSDSQPASRGIGTLNTMSAPYIRPDVAASRPSTRVR